MMGSQRKQRMEPPSSPALKPTSSNVRTKFLSVIGIEKSVATTTAAEQTSLTSSPNSSNARSTTMTTNSSSSSRTEWMRPIRQPNRFEETLKYNPEEEALYSPKRKQMDSTSGSSSTEEKPRKKISFDAKVKVMPIPMRDEYSNRVRSRLWSNAVEIHENATRNSIEFASEGWDWRAVMEDECMFVDVVTGDLVHPCHYDVESEKTQET